MPISGSILQVQALDMAVALNIATFTASTGEFDFNKACHDITINQICGEAKDAEEVTNLIWKEMLHTFIDGYAACDIHNGDERGSVFRALFNKSLFLQGNKYIRGQMSKVKITAYLCGNMVYQMETPQVVMLL